MPRKNRKATVRGKLQLSQAIIDNPDWRPDRDGEKAFPRTIPAAVNVRESAIETLFARGSLTKLQKTAADTFRAHWESYSREQIAAIDYSRQHVDGGKTVAPISQHRARARRELARARSEIGARNYRLLVSVCGHGRALSDLFPFNGKDDGPMKLRRLAAAENLRTSLDDVAGVWGLASAHSQRKAG